MSSFQREVKAGSETLTISVEADARLRRWARWRLHGQTVYLRVPTRMSRAQIDTIIEDILPRIVKQRKRARRQADTSLTERAETLNRQYFGGGLSWHTIRWAKNMKRRLGSFTTGGTTDGDIRISERIRNWPGYVIDYVLAHEICHRQYPNHSQEFWACLSRYPFMDKALGFLEGIAYAEGTEPDRLLD